MSSDNKLQEVNATFLSAGENGIALITAVHLKKVKSSAYNVCLESMDPNLQTFARLISLQRR